MMVLLLLLCMDHYMLHQIFAIGKEINGFVVTRGSRSVVVLCLQQSRAFQGMNGSPDGPVQFHYPADNYLDDLLDSTR